MPHKDFFVNGSKWPSATELTGLLPQHWKWKWYRTEVKKHGWRGWQKCDAQSNRGKRIGTHTHGLVEATLRGLSYDIPEPPRRKRVIIALANELLKQIDPSKILGIEQHLVSTQHRVHGTADLITIEGIKDWKTSGSMGIDYPLQLAIYLMGWNEEHPDCQLKDGEINRADKKAKTPYVQNRTYADLHFYYPVVDALRVVWDYLNKQGPWEENSEC